MGSPSSRESDASFKANAPDSAPKAAKRDLEKISVSLTVNGQRRALTIEPRMNRSSWPTRWQIPLGTPTSLDLGHFELAGEAVA